MTDCILAGLRRTGNYPSDAVRERLRQRARFDFQAEIGARVEAAPGNQGGRRR